MRQALSALFLLLFACAHAAPESPGVGVAARAAGALVRIQNSDGMGTGFAIDEKTIATALHVVGLSYNQVTTVSGQSCDVEAVTLSLEDDVALLRVSGCALAPLEVRRTPTVRGEQVFAAGYPLGMPKWAFTTGSIMGEYEGRLLTDATIAPGNSGGPLLDYKGRVVGIVVALFTRTPIGIVEPAENFLKLRAL